MHATRMSEPDPRRSTASTAASAGRAGVDAARLPRLGAGPRRQCGRRPAPARHVRLAARGRLALLVEDRVARGSAPEELAGLADFVAAAWLQPDAGIWESRDEPQHYVLSKAMCWTALDASRDSPMQAPSRSGLPGVRRLPASASGWRARAGTKSDARIAARRATTCRREPPHRLALCAYADAADERLAGTVDALRAELGDGPFLFASPAPTSSRARSSRVRSGSSTCSRAPAAGTKLPS